MKASRHAYRYLGRALYLYGRGTVWKYRVPALCLRGCQRTVLGWPESERAARAGDSRKNRHETWLERDRSPIPFPGLIPTSIGGRHFSYLIELVHCSADSVVCPLTPDIRDLLRSHQERPRSDVITDSRIADRVARAAAAPLNVCFYERKTGRTVLLRILQ